MSDSTPENAAEKIVEANTAAIKKGTERAQRLAAEATAKTAEKAQQFTDAATEHMTKASETVSRTSQASMAGFQELTSAYQEMATRNAERLRDSIQALTQVKSPVEFMALQQKLITEGVSAAISDSSNMAKLTASVFISALQPAKDQLPQL